jgi:hypothetical protein
VADTDLQVYLLKKHSKILLNFDHKFELPNVLVYCLLPIDTHNIPLLKTETPRRTKLISTFRQPHQKTYVFRTFPKG